MIDPLGLIITYAGTPIDVKILQGYVATIGNSSPQAKEWLHDIQNSPINITIQFGESEFGIAGSFSTPSTGGGLVMIDPRLKDPHQKDLYYTGYGKENATIIEKLFGSTEYYSPEGVLAHELFGHGHDFISNPMSFVQDEKTAIERANIVREALGKVKRRIPNTEECDPI